MVKVIISDCDHASIEIERSILDEAKIEFELQQNKTEEDVIQNCKQAVVIINQYAPFTEKVLASLPNLKLIIRYGVGVNNIDLEAATKHGIQVCNVPDYGTHEVADHALALMLALTRKIPFMNGQVKNGQWDYQTSIPIFRHSEQTVGIVGLGRIGSAFAKKIHGLGMKVIAFDPSKQQKALAGDLQFVEFTSFDQLIQTADIISIHCPSDGAYHMFNKEVFKAMQPHSYLINVSRGGIIDEAALYEAIVNREIAGAGLDVSETEPIDLKSPLLQLDEVIVTPHMAWYSKQAAQELKRKVAKEAVRYLEGQEVHYPVNSIK
ncbi:C-terminal binding protein [Solibacillus silvestris]|uniref:C-terminal binding protein n=1 Tax=Solibacillus silvestris TaxID=76853 RepID=UPI003F7FD0E7